MKKTSKIIVVALALMLCVTCFAGCGSSSTTTGEDGTITKIVFGTNPEFEPFEYVTSNEADGYFKNEAGEGYFTGIDMAIAKEIADTNGIEASVENLEFDSLLIALENGQIDAAIAGMTITEERKKSVDFTDPYYVATQVMVVKEDSTIAKASDMKDKKIVVVQGYTGETAVRELGYEANMTSLKKGTEAVLEVVNGKADVMVIDSATAEKYLKENKGLKIVTDAETFGSEEYGIAVKKGNTQLLELLNKGIAAVKENGKLDEFITKFTEN